MVDNDWAGDPDGLVALAHHLLAPGNRVDAVTSSQLNPQFGSPDGTAAAGAALARELVDLLGLPHRPPVHMGTDHPFPGLGSSDGAANGSAQEPAVGTPRSAASDAIVEHALRDDELPLVVVCGGPLTNVAAALATEPRIAARMTLAWVGGSLHDGPEDNRDTDPAAAAHVLATRDLAVWQYPLETYRRCAATVTEIEQDIGGCGAPGAWLWQRFTTLPLPEWLRVESVWPLGDSAPLVGVALADESSTWVDGARAAGVTGGSGTAPRRVYTDVDFRLITADMLALFRRHAAGVR